MKLKSHGDGSCLSELCLALFLLLEPGGCSGESPNLCSAQLSAAEGDLWGFVDIQLSEELKVSVAAGF